MNPLALATAAPGRDNNFLLIRMILATLVVFSHSFTFTNGDERLEPLFQLTTIPFGYVAVDAFFVMSGFLIAQSWLRRQDIASFAMARVSRIYPALWVNIAFVATISAFITARPAGLFLTDPLTWKWIAKNLIMVLGGGGDLPGLFANNPRPNWTNIPLWTLSWELNCYIGVAFLGLLGLFRKRAALLVLSAIVVSIHLYDGYVDTDTWMANFRFPAMFSVGMCFFLYRDKITLRWSAFAAVTLAFALCLWLFPSDFEWVYPILLPYFIFCLVFLPGGWLRRYNRCGDYSYGMYIYGGFIGQVIAMIPGIQLFDHLILTEAITLSLAYLSWTFVESRILKAPWRQPATDWIRRHLPRYCVQTA